MDEQIDRAFNEGPDMPAAMAERIRAQIRRDTQPVKPMMHPGAYALLFASVPAAVGILYAVFRGMAGLSALTVQMAWVLCVLLTLLVMLSAAMVARSMRPGSGRLYSLGLTFAGLVTYEAIVLTSFVRDYSMIRFVHAGLICLAIGVGCGIVTALPIWVVVRRGMIVEPVSAGAVIGLAGGLAGWIALTLHCPVITTPHAAVWHAAVVVICAGAGALAGRFLIRYR
jgi:hypothetical protein